MNAHVVRPQPELPPRLGDLMLHASENERFAFCPRFVMRKKWAKPATNERGFDKIKTKKNRSTVNTNERPRHSQCVFEERPSPTPRPGLFLPCRIGDPKRRMTTSGPPILPNDVPYCSSPTDRSFSTGFSRMYSNRPPPPSLSEAGFRALSRAPSSA